MMHISTIEQLQKQANVSFEEAKEALEMTEWNLLDAYVWLEARGKLDKMPTEGEKEEERKAEEAEAMESSTQGQQAGSAAGGFISNLLRMFRENRLVARGGQGRIWSISLLALVLGVIFLRKFAFIAFLLALVMQVKFSIEGPDTKKKD